MIAFLINELDVRGGTHKQLLKLLDYLDSNNIDFIIITRRLEINRTFLGFKKFENYIKVLNNKNRSKNFFLSKLYDLESMFKLLFLLKDIEVINIHDTGFEYFFPIFFRKKVYWQINDMPHCFKAGISKGKTTFKNSITKKYIQFFSSNITDFSVNVSKNKMLIEKYFNREAHVFYCGIEPVEIIRDKVISINRFKQNSVNILTSGVFYPYRNYETQIDVVDKLVKQGIDVTLNIIGSIEADKKYYESIVMKINDLGLNEHINICGQVDESTFNELHKDADIFLFINIDQSWGLAVFEAMSCGIPVLVSNSVGAVEILSDQINSIFVDPIDVDSICLCITDLMRDEVKYMTICKNSQQFHKNFTWDNSYCINMSKLII